MNNRIFSLALAVAANSASAAPVYEIIDSIGQQAKGVTVMQVKAFDLGDAAACEHDRAARRQRNKSIGQIRCVRELPITLAALPHDGPVSKAYVVKTVLPNDGGALYTVRSGMSTKNPPEVCKNLIAYEKMAESSYFVRNARISCTVPAP